MRMILTPIELLNGIFSLIIVFFSTTVGILISSRYFKHKQISLLYIGLLWIGLVSIWFAISIATLSILITGTQIPDTLYMFISNGFLPLTSIVGIMGFSELLFKEHQKKIVLPYIIYGAIFEIILVEYLLIDPYALGRLNSPVDATYGIFVTIYQIFLLLTFVIFSTLFARVSLRAENPEVNLKGKLILAAAYCFLAGAIMDIIGEISIVILITGRILLIFSSFLFYGGFVLPNWMKKLLKKG